MYEWSETDRAVEQAIRQFVDSEIRPRREELEFGDLPPYDILRKLWKTFGIDAMASDAIEKRLAAQEAGDPGGTKGRGGMLGGAAQASMGVILIKEICRVCPGFVGAFGVSL